MSAAYWMTVEEIRQQRALGEPVDRALHMVTRAYEQVASPEVRAGYNLTLGDTTESLTTRRLTRRRWGIIGREPAADYYELMGLHETAPQELVAEAYLIMRAVYTRARVDADRRALLFSWLEKARSTLSNPQRRAQYDLHRAASELPAASGAGLEPASLGALLTRLVRVLFPAFRREPQPGPQPTMFARLATYLQPESQQR